jgi:hypothetical protein
LQGLAIVLLFITNLALLYSHHVQTREWQKERKDLYDRIMSKDLREYKAETEPVKIYKPVDNSEESEWEKEQESKKV